MVSARVSYHTRIYRKLAFLAIFILALVLVAPSVIASANGIMRSNSVLPDCLVMDTYRKTTTEGIKFHVSTMNCGELTVIDNPEKPALTAEIMFSKIESESAYNFTTVSNDSLSSLGVTSIIDFEKTRESMFPY